MDLSARFFVLLLIGAVVIVVSTGGALIGTLWGLGLKCDESCGEPPPWRDDPEAWQWTAIGWTSIGAAVVSIAFLVFLLSRRTTAAAATLAAWGGLASTFLFFFGSSGLTSNVHRGWIGLVVIVLAAGAAVALTRPQPRRG